MLLMVRLPSATTSGMDPKSLSTSTSWETLRAASLPDAIATEQIKNSIEAIKKDRTVIIISHSISQIIDSEMVYALQKGRVEQSGHPDEVYKKGGIYKDIIDASARSLNIEKIAKTLEG